MFGLLRSEKTALYSSEFLLLQKDCRQFMQVLNVNRNNSKPGIDLESPTKKYE